MSGMEGNNSGKLSSRSGKSNKVIPAGLADAKQKKAKKKKKGRRNSNKPEADEISKLTSDDDKNKLEVEGIGALENDSEESSGTATGHTKLPMIPASTSGNGEERVSPSSGSGTPQSAPLALSTASSMYRPGQAAVVNSLVHKINSLNIKPKQNGTGRASNGQLPRGGGGTRPPNRPGVGRQVGRQGRDNTKGSSSTGGNGGAKSAPAVVKVGPANAFVSTSTTGAAASGSLASRFAASTQPLTLTSSQAESLRWENVLDDSEEERERIRLYKINRRKRYLAAAQAKGLGWALKQSFQIADDYGLDARNWSTTTAGSTSFQTTDYAPMRSLRASGGHGMMAAAMVEC